IDSVLTFKTTKKITSSKRMNIKVNYGDHLKHIEVKEDAEVRSLTSLELKNATLKTSGSAKAYLNIRTNNFNFTNNDKARVKLNVTANNADVILSDNSKTDATFNIKSLKLDMYQRADINVEGVSDHTL